MTAPKAHWSSSEPLLLSLLWHSARARRRRPRHVAALRELPRGRPARSDGALLPAQRVGLREMLPRPTQRVRRAGGDLHRVRLLLVVLGIVAQARRGLRGDDHRAPRSRARQLRRRTGQQRRVPAAVLRAAWHPVSWRGAGGERRQGRRRPRGAHRRLVLRRAAGWRAGSGSRSRRPRAGQQRARPSARPQRLRRRDPADSQAGRDDDDRVPARHADARPEPVRHHLPRALLLLLADQRPDDLRRPRHDDLRRRRDLDPRWFAADLRPAQRRRDTAGEREGP